MFWGLKLAQEKLFEMKCDARAGRGWMEGDIEICFSGRLYIKVKRSLGMWRLKGGIKRNQK